MKTIRLLIFLLLTVAAQAAYTEFYVQTTGNNLNAGSTTADAAAFTYAGGTFVRGTGIFTVASGNPLTDGVVAGDFASIYTTAGATVATFVARVTARDATTITVSLTAIAGATSTVSEGAGEATCKVGGAWDGPDGAQDFPFDFATTTMTDASGNMPRVNFKNGVEYSVSAAMTHTLTGPIRFQGYTTNPGDLGRAIITTSGTASFVMLNLSGNACEIVDFIFYSGFTSGTSIGVTVSAGYRSVFNRVVVHDVRGTGIALASAGGFAIECEVYLANKAVGANAGFAIAAGNGCVRCISHDNAGTSTSGGFLVTGQGYLINCISDSNSGLGYGFAGTLGQLTMVGCEAYNNSGDGLNLSAATGSAVLVENCNFIKNGGYGINSSGSTIRNGLVVNTGFGAGTQVNTSGQIATAASWLETSGNVTYADNVTPWVDPANGDFRINLATAKGDGRGTFTQTASSYTGTVGYPDIGAAQHQESASAGGEHSHVWAQ